MTFDLVTVQIDTPHLHAFNRACFAFMSIIPLPLIFSSFFFLSHYIMPPKRKAASAASEAITSIQTPITRSTRSKSDAAAKKAKIEEPTVTLLQEGDQLPDDLPPVTTDKGAEVRVQDLAKESGLLIFFYPRANTPGCTTQACGFRDRYSDLVAEGWKVYGMSYGKFFLYFFMIG